MINNPWLNSRKELYINSETAYLVLRSYRCRNVLNEVMCLSEDMGIQIYYQDTDSMHIPRDDVSSLASAFQAKYNRELIGSKLGQFHSDFPGTNVDGSEVYAVESYFIWKKAYIDKL